MTLPAFGRTLFYNSQLPDLEYRGKVNTKDSIQYIGTFASVYYGLLKTPNPTFPIGFSTNLTLNFEKIKAFMYSFLVRFMALLCTIVLTKGGNSMMLKLKICSTVWVLYEVIVVMMLHCPQTCEALLSGRFCMDSVYKYFVFCFAVPALIGLILMWIMSIVHAVRRRRSLLYRAESAVKDVAMSLQHKIRESISGPDLQKYIIGAVLAGVKKYSDYHPNMRRAIDGIISVITGEEDTTVSATKSAATRTTHAAKSKAAHKKKK